MNTVTVRKKSYLKGEFTPPGDKSVSHRAVMLGSLAQGNTTVTNFCPGDDTLRTVNAFRSLGVIIEGTGTQYTIAGKGLHGLHESSDVIDAGNSGTTARLITGLLSGQDFFTTISGDGSLRSRPMRRVTKPLGEMGAKIDGRAKGDYLPLCIRGTLLSPLKYTLPVPSAQVKSAILLAGLYAEGVTEITEPLPSRDHTERMLAAMGGSVERHGAAIRVQGFPELKPLSFRIPGDVSSAAFLIVAATILPGSEVTIRKVGTNPLRSGILEVLQRMGAQIQIIPSADEGGEPTADIVVTSSSLKGVVINGEVIPRIIDEIPILAVAAAHAEGTTIIRDAKELRVKETDRITAIVEGLKKFGVTAEEFDDGMAITGQENLSGATVPSYGDHRIAMAFIIAGLTASGETTVQDTEVIGISFPQFMETVGSLFT
ncbi:MAG: 3-phosphoshikimate 1-carboxyvinyltransferase [Deltaproteobacteria bacterium]|nr:3-phosphoshikimate 1-carboxyvinyltransferase [Deltaproteobacteria bacterium]